MEVKMTKKIINPWAWQDKFGFVQANQINDGKKLLFFAGQVSVDESGNLLYSGDMEKQIDQIFDNLETILDQAGMQLQDIVRLTYFTTDISKFTNASRVLIHRLEKGNCKPATSLIGVASLFHPDCVIELEATAVV
jgi:enamine deaminase RidA (YjgF/YER057c/UK114 family)